MRKILLFATLITVGTCSCVQKKPQAPIVSIQKNLPSVKHLDWTRNAVIYEVNVRQYTKEGTFAAFEKQLPQLKELGVDVLWFMPIYPISKKNRKGSLGSYYAITDYTAVNPEFGTKDDFRRVVDEAHKMGFKVVIDWVANHTGWDSKWISDHPEWYVRDSTGAVKSPYDWTDVAKLNYKNKDMRTAMINSMKYWIKDFDIDGFRCDMAHEVPTDFWNEVRPQLDSIKPMFMLAESENNDLMDHAFDAQYAWENMHLMSDVAKGKKPVDSIATYIQNLDTLKCTDAYKMNCLTNHDENSWNGTEYERYGKAVDVCAVLSYTLNGMPLIYTGQEVGMKKRLKFFDKDKVDSWTKNSTFAFYQKLNELKHTQPALNAGNEGGKIKVYKISNSDKILVFSREKLGKKVLVLLNFSPNLVTFASNDTLGNDEYLDYFSGKKTGIPYTLKPYEYRVLVR